MDFRIPDAPVASWAAALAPLALEAWPLEPPMPHERPHLLRGEAAPLIDGLLGRGPEGRPLLVHWEGPPSPP